MLNTVNEQFPWFGEAGLYSLSFVEVVQREPDAGLPTRPLWDSSSQRKGEVLSSVPLLLL